jgi:predicted lipoprotein
VHATVGAYNLRRSSGLFDVTGKYNTPKYWRLRAEEARVVAEHLRNVDAKRSMWAIAQGYERLAETAEQLERSAAALAQAPAPVNR